MKKDRIELLIQILKSNHGYLTGKELGNLLNVSDRTIRNYVNDINRKAGKDIILSDLRLGYKIGSEYAEEAKSDIPQTSEERVNYLINELLKDHRGINLTFLQEQLFVSSYVIDNDIGVLRRKLKKYTNLKLVNAKNHLYLEGSEASKRQLYKEMLLLEINNSFINLDKIADVFSEFDFYYVKDEFIKILEEANYQLKKDSLVTLLIHISVSVHRSITIKKYVREERTGDQTIEWFIANKFLTKVENQFNIGFEADEAERLADLLRINQKYREKSFGDVSFEGLVNEIIQMVMDKFGIDLSVDDDFKYGLTVHLQGLYNRAMTKMDYDDYFVNDLKKRYPFIFEMAIAVKQFIERKLEIEVANNETSFLALHFGAAYERINTANKMKAYVVLPYGESFCDMCTRKLQLVFGERMTISGQSSFFEERIVKEEKPDLLITTSELNHDLDIPTVIISVFVSSEDEAKVLQALNAVEKGKANALFTSQLLGLIQEQKFFYELEMDNPVHVIEYMCDRLIGYGEVNERFKAEVLQREEDSPTSFVYSFAIPHAMSSNAYASSLSVALLRNPIKWGEFDVKLVMLLALKEEDREIFELFFNWLAKIIMSADNFSRLLESKDFMEFISILKEGA